MLDVFANGASDDRESSRRRYSVVFFGASVRRATKLASVLSVAGIRVHHAASAAEVRTLLKITCAGIVLIDARTVGRCDKTLGELTKDFPDICTVVLSPLEAETSSRLYAGGAWEVIVEPTRLLDMLAALESAHEFHEELADPVRRQSRIDGIVGAIRQRGMAASPRASFTGGLRLSKMRVIRRPRPIH